MPCPDENTLAAWSDGELEGAAKEALETHIEGCVDCRALVIELARSPSLAPAELTSNESAAPPLAVGTRMGRYIVLDWLGAGGMGVVVAAFDPELDRRVAIKILRADRSEEAARTLLLREAQLLARVSHPNVLTIYDVGTHQGRVFFAMEYVRGETLGAWLDREPRAWNAVLACFLDAARGVAAAHAAGLVHRDIKPSNVLVSLDGRVQVTDFGLARPTRGPLVEAKTSGESGSWNGTPRYMSPEQRAGERVDARSDQYSFCVALHEALFGAPGAEPRDSASASVPAHVKAALARGLEEVPAKRFPTMDALRAALELRRAQPWKQLVLALVAAALCALGVAAFTRARPPFVSPCAGAEQKLNGVWDADRKGAISRAFSATEAPYAGDVWREVEATLDAYATSWKKMHRDACEATRVRGEQSEELLDRRMACLDGVARELGALAESLASANKKLVEVAVQRAHELPPVNACADATTLKAARRPPVNPASEAAALRVRAGVDRANVASYAGRYKEAVTMLEPLLDPVKTAGDRSLEAQLDYVLGTARMHTGDVKEADAALYDAIESAESANDDVTKARTLVQLAFTLANNESKYDEAMRAGALAAAVLTRLPEEIALSTQLELNLAVVDDVKGHYKEGLEKAERARERREKTFGPNDYLTATALETSAAQLSYLGQKEKALEYHRRALVIFERALGSHHRKVAMTLHNIGVEERALDRCDDALRDIRRGREIWREVYGDEHPELAKFHSAMAETLLRAERAAEAKVEIDKTLAISEKFHFNEVDIVDMLNLVGAIDTMLAHFDEALTALARAHALCVKLSSPLFETATTLSLTGDAYLSSGRAAKAVDPLERSLALRTTEATNPIDVAETRVLLGRALWDAGGDRARAVMLISQARDAYSARPELKKEGGKAEQWLATHTFATPRAPD